jgi:hypothetical protein
MYKKFVSMATLAATVLSVFAGTIAIPMAVNPTPAHAAWSEPVIGPVMMTAPLTPPPSNLSNHVPVHNDDYVIMSPSIGDGDSNILPNATAFLLCIPLRNSH